MNNKNKATIKATEDKALTQTATKDLHAHQIDLINCIKVTGACNLSGQGGYGDCLKDKR